MQRLVYNLIRTYNLVLTILPAMHFYRAAVQPDYSWKWLNLEGTGRSENFIWLSAFMMLSWITFALERWYRKAWYYLLPVALFGVVAAILLFNEVNKVYTPFMQEASPLTYTLGLALAAVVLWVTAIVWGVAALRDFEPAYLKARPNDGVKFVGISLLSIVIGALFYLGAAAQIPLLNVLAVLTIILQALMCSWLVEKSSTAA